MLQIIDLNSDIPKRKPDDISYSLRSVKRSIGIFLFKILIFYKYR